VNDVVTKLAIVLPVILVSMSLHEMMHAFSSYVLGDETAYLQGRLSINPLRHIDPFLTVALPILLVLAGAAPFGAAKPVQVNFRHLKYGDFGSAIVGISGPLTNLLIALLASFILRGLHPSSLLIYKILGYTILVNVGFFIFNLIPWPPLDGSRLLYAFAPEPLQEAMARIESLGFSGLIIFMLIFTTLLSSPFSNLVLHLSDRLAAGLI
jgi:Zn-dependent protease